MSTCLIKHHTFPLTLSFFKILEEEIRVNLLKKYCLKIRVPVFQNVLVYKCCKRSDLGPPLCLIRIRTGPLCPDPQRFSLSGSSPVLFVRIRTDSLCPDPHRFSLSGSAPVLFVRIRNSAPPRSLFNNYFL